MESISTMFQNGIDVAALLKVNDISADVQSHLSKVYAALALSVLLAAAGAAAAVAAGVNSSLASLAGLGLLFWFMATPPTAENAGKRWGLFAAFSVAQGVGLGGLTAVLLAVDPSILVTAFLATLVVFACFSGAALLSKRRSYLYLGGALSSALSWLMLASFVSLFWRSQLLFSAQLYIGLAVIIGFTAFDTQMIVELAAAGDRDVLGHAVRLFVDFVGLFVRIAIILLRNSEKKEERRRERR